MKKAFNKPPTTYAEQVALLKTRGMVIADTNQAAFSLQHINYYRLCSYWLPFEQNRTTHQFYPNVRLEDVISLYNFDRQLRLLVLDGIELIEVSVRAQWAYQIAHLHGPHAHLQENLFDRYWRHNLSKLKDEVARADETFIHHLRETYSEPLPPIWAVCEVMSLGLLSRFYTSLKPKRTCRVIASKYGLDESVLQSWLHHLSLVRNVCAHHSRLWNREFKVIPKVPISKPKGMSGQLVPNSRRIYNTIVIIMYLTETISPGNTWKKRFKSLINEYQPPINSMGFPENWRDRAIWK